eukprot:c27142_g1_i2 orf=166-816(+)
MKTEQLPLEDALASLRTLHECACPNDGFLEQLKLFEEMGFAVDHDNLIYKKFHVDKMGEAYRSGQKIEMSRFAVDPVETSNLMVKLENQISNFNLPQHSQERHSASYRCKRCRRILAVESNVLLHSPGKGDVSFRRKKRDKSLFDEEREPGCTSIFVEPMQWMNTVQEGVVMGKLSCPNCRARLGTFNWAGMQCSCGSWVIPAFQLHKSRMDMENL